MTSWKTAMARTKPSAPLQWLLSKQLIKGTVLDYGCGQGADVRFLDTQFSTVGYDPHWKPNELSPGARFDTVLCTYVLNVITPEEEAAVLVRLGQLVEPGGEIFIAVRRDLPVEGAKGRGCWQRHVPCPDGYESIHSNTIYELFRRKV